MLELYCLGTHSWLCLLFYIHSGYTYTKNYKCIHYEYKIGDKILLDRSDILQKMTSPCNRPYEIQKVLTNQTIHIPKCAITQIVNICHLQPYYTQILSGST